MSKLFFIGDSITTGAWDEKGGWANRLIAAIMTKTISAKFEEGAFYCCPYNLGVSGDTVAGILLRLEKEVSLRIFPEDPREALEFVFAIGVNDSVYMVEEERPRFTDIEFQNNLHTLIKLAQKFTQRIHFVGLCPVNDNLLNPIPWAPDKAYANKHVKNHEDMIAEVCSKNNISFLPLFDKWMSMPNWQEYLIDGVHPNSKGHKLLAEQIGEFLFTDQFYSFHLN